MNFTTVQEKLNPMYRTCLDQWGEARGSELNPFRHSSHTFLSFLLKLPPVTRREREGERGRERMGEICQSFAGVKKAAKRRTDSCKGKNGGGWTPCHSWACAEVQWRGAHPRAESIFEVQVHQSIFSRILLFNFPSLPSSHLTLCLQLWWMKWLIHAEGFVFWGRYRITHLRLKLWALNVHFLFLFATSMKYRWCAACSLVLVRNHWEKKRSSKKDWNGFSYFSFDSA